MVNTMKRSQKNICPFVWIVLICFLSLLGVVFRINICMGKIVKDSSTNTQQERNSQLDRDGATFLFLMGVEGSGHHLYNELFHQHMESGNGLDKKFLEEYNLHTKFHPDPVKHPSLYSSTCSEEPPNGIELFNEVVDLMKTIDDRVRSEEIDGAVVPINGVFSGHMNSYPSLLGNCRPLQYPDVDLTYRACEKAGVDCRHIMVHRDPYEIIKSTTMNRKFGLKHRQIKLMSTMLDVMNTQMISHPDNLFACWSYNNGPESILDIGELLGWDNDKFMKVYAKIFRPSKPLTDEERTEVISPELQPFMDSMIKAAARVEATCDSIIESRE